MVIAFSVSCSACPSEMSLGPSDRYSPGPKSAAQLNPQTQDLDPLIASLLMEHRQQNDPPIRTERRAGLLP